VEASGIIDAEADLRDDSINLRSQFLKIRLKFEKNFRIKYYW
jgi:hypothetical protein